MEVMCNTIPVTPDTSSTTVKTVSTKDASSTTAATVSTKKASSTSVAPTPRNNLSATTTAEIEYKPDIESTSNPGK